ncbi:mucin-1-like [Canis lupus dingo]|uniref:mucin-1-like n=1 Tax=Canis lupus dingo TaxID=286419 RepID=UPI0018F79FF9|nr:mucin-1-like [Canis lupus dingo]XP_035569653.2 mucin-1-like [Canis lupus dingo]XP_048949189.1 mucin-1-like [Canis lupus dingo]XP_048949190.1 mucin-1-like [Canis lupus dingo]XP_048949191.1 mucin-1-like [Canis lupus dingo]XP_048949192.1 mucin-1-like [Canis lupus dingo]XP_048949193.1 mucin-1-like [Canis lupus dingo]
MVPSAQGGCQQGLCGLDCRVLLPLRASQPRLQESTAQRGRGACGDPRSPWLRSGSCTHVHPHGPSPRAAWLSCPPLQEPTCSLVGQPAALGLQLHPHPGAAARSFPPHAAGSSGHEWATRLLIPTSYTSPGTEDALCRLLTGAVGRTSPRKLQSAPGAQQHASLCARRPRPASTASTATTASTGQQPHPHASPPSPGTSSKPPAPSKPARNDVHARVPAGAVTAGSHTATASGRPRPGDTEPICIPGSRFSLRPDRKPPRRRACGSRPAPRARAPATLGGKQAPSPRAGPGPAATPTRAPRACVLGHQLPPLPTGERPADIPTTAAKSADCREQINPRS